MGTRGFMSPEQSTDARAVGVHADIFSLGRTLYYLLSGRNPYPQVGLLSLLAEESGEDPVIPLDTICPGVPTEVLEVMGRMSARRSEDRFQSCEEVLAALAPLCMPGGAVRTAERRRWWRSFS
jgi:serine/threonine protein kinase